MTKKNSENTLDVIFDSSKTLKQSNRLIEAHYTLSLIEQKIILAIISQLGKNDDDFFTCKVNANDLANFCDFTSTNKYSRIKNASAKLMRRVVNIRLDNNDFYMSHWVQSMRYKKDGTIIYKLDPDLKPELLQLQKAYLSEKPKPIMHFSSQYACRFYLLFKQYLKIKRRKFDISEIISMFQLNTKTYSRISNLKSRVIEPAIDELNEKSDLVIDYEYLKESRKIVAINFKFKLKVYSKTKVESSPKIKNYSTILKTLFDLGINKDAAIEIEQKYSENLILQTISKAKKDNKNKAKDNIAGFIIKAIHDDYYHIENLPPYIKQQQIEKEKQRKKNQNIIPVFEQDNENNTISSDSPFKSYLKKHI